MTDSQMSPVPFPSIRGDIAIVNYVADVEFLNCR